MTAEQRNDRRVASTPGDMVDIQAAPSFRFLEAPSYGAYTFHEAASRLRDWMTHV